MAGAGRDPIRKGRHHRGWTALSLDGTLILMLSRDITTRFTQPATRQPLRRRRVLLLGVVSIAACSSGDGDDDTATSVTTAQSESTTATPSISATTTVSPTTAIAATVPPTTEPAPSSSVGSDGEVQQGSVRVVPGTVSFAGPFDPDADCGAAVWTMQWTAQSPSAGPILVTTSDGAMRSDEFDPVLSDLTDHGTPAATAGSLTGSACFDAAFAFPTDSTNENEAVDVAYEVQSSLADVDATTTTTPSDVRTPPPAVSCDGYEPAVDSLPIEPCTDGLAVIEVQDRLTQLGYPLDADGVFGPATAAAVVAFQIQGGQIPDGIVGLRTWARLFEGVDLRGEDLDGNGIVTPEEIVYD